MFVFPLGGKIEGLDEEIKRIIAHYRWVMSTP